MMLHHMDLSPYADKIQKAAMETIKDGKCLTGDLGGSAKCSEFTDAIIRNIEWKKYWKFYNCFSIAYIYCEYKNQNQL